MLGIYHHPLCPFSRKLRVVLNEKKVDYELVIERFWERREDFLKLNPACETPVILDEDGHIIVSNTAIFEYIEEQFLVPDLLGQNSLKRAKVRTICEWFDYKFFTEVTKYIINEKFIKVITCSDGPNSNAIRAAKKNITYHIDYLLHLLQDNDYICGERMSLADVSAAVQFSVLDFLGEVPWDRSIRVKHWYSLIKSRPSFKPILLDKVQNFYPPRHYSNPDF